MKFTHIPLLVVLTILWGAGCASAPEKIPEVRSDELPQSAFRALKPKTLRLVVVNDRKVNKQAGNADQVERTVRKALTDALANSGVKVSGSAPNTFNVYISDYTGKPDDGECVKFIGNLQTASRVYVSAESFGCHTVKNMLFGIKMGGDISEAYTKALSVLLETADKKLNEINGT